jgi:hypothetical protein
MRPFLWPASFRGNSGGSSRKSPDSRSRIHPSGRGQARALIRALKTLSTRTLVLVSGRHALLGIAQTVLRPRLERLEVEFKQMLAAFAECLLQGDCRRALPSINGALSEMEEAPERIRKAEMLKGQYQETPCVRLLELVDHYRATAESLEECRRLIGSPKIHRYWGHCGL